MAKEWYIIDYISWIEVPWKPEEIEAVQPFAKALVEDYWYPKDLIITHPQYRVKVRPSDTKKEYPVDIAVFSKSPKDEDTVYIVVECKKKNRKDWRSQLQDYLRFSRASLWVWFNGNERFFLRKVENNWRVDFEEIPNIPKYWERIEDIGKFKRKDLRPTHNLKATFRAIRNHLAANTVGATRDEVLAQQLINLIFCKIYDERFTLPDDEVTFRAWIWESPNIVKNRVLSIFDKVKKQYSEVLWADDVINLDANSIVYVVWELQNYCLIEAERDVIADAFETFIWHALKWWQWQFFTPRNVIKMMVEILDPWQNDLIIDPACWSWWFLIEALRYVWRKIDSEWKKYNLKNDMIIADKQSFASDKIRWIDKDYFLSKVTKAYMVIVWDGKSWIFTEDSLEVPKHWQASTQSKIQLWTFDVILTNPPFGSKIPVRWEEKLKQFNLWYKRKLEKKDNNWERDKLKDKEAPQILFIERCLQLLKDWGRMAIVLPDWIYGNNKLWYIRKYIMWQARIVAVIDVPVETFMPNTATKTSILVIQKTTKVQDDYPVFMAIAESCGHDRRWATREDDDIALIPEAFNKWKEENGFSF